LISKDDEHLILAHKQLVVLKIDDLSLVTSISSISSINLKELKQNIESIDIDDIKFMQLDKRDSDDVDDINDDRFYIGTSSRLIVLMSMSMSISMSMNGLRPLALYNFNEKSIFNCGKSGVHGHLRCIEWTSNCSISQSEFQFQTRSHVIEAVGKKVRVWDFSPDREGIHRKEENCICNLFKPNTKKEFTRARHEINFDELDDYTDISFAVNPNHNVFAVNTKKDVKLFSIDKCKYLGQISDLSENVCKVTFTDDGMYLMCTDIIKEGEKYVHRINIYEKNLC
jgi:hypothetical protein